MRVKDRIIKVPNTQSVEFIAVSQKGVHLPFEDDIDVGKQKGG
jgi:hypothetical protein